VRVYAPLQTPGGNWAAATAMALIAQQVAGKAVRDALFLSNFHVHALLFAMAAAAALSLAAVLSLTHLLSRRSPASVLPLLFALSACGFATEWFVGLTSPRLSAALVYVHTALFGPTLITTFWSLISERFDPNAAKRAVARISGGGTLGGVVGGVAAWRASTFMAVPTLLLLLAALNALGAIGTLLLRARRAPLESPEVDAAPTHSATVSTLSELRNVPFLRNLALLVALGAATSTLLDYVFSAQAAIAIEPGRPLLHFFALFWVVVSVVSFTLQMSLGRLALERLSLALNIAFLPCIIILGGAFGIAVPGLTSAALLRGGEAVQRNTLFRSAYELLYTPLSPERKRATKTLIDIGFDRVGTIFGSGFAFAMVYLLARPSMGILLGVVVFLALLTLPLARQLHVGYVEALQQSLRAGAAKLELPIPDRAEPPAAEHRDRERLIEKVEWLRDSRLTDDSERSVDKAPAWHALDDSEGMLADARDLLSKDEVRARRALAVLSGAGPATSCALFLLAHPRLQAEALSALRRVAPLITGQLLDALLDPTMDFVVRRRIPRVLSACHSQRAADGLLLGIGDERFEVRYQCGRALLRLTDAKPELVISRDKIIEVIRRELEVGKQALETVAQEDFDDTINPDEQSSLMETLTRDRVDRSLEHVFSILALHLEREPLRIAFRALHHEDSHHRGTALEYLDTILPAEVRDAMWPYLGGAAPLRTARSPNEILGELVAAAVRRP
jgi:AAA family ATP:ADP antiporter